MTPSEAQAAIGERLEDDHILKPLKHADELQASAQSLASVLRGAQIRVLAEQHERHDEAAGKAQSVYKSTLSAANRAVFAATVLGALMMAAQIVAPFCPFYQTALQRVGIGAGILAGLAATLASMWLFKAREGQLLERWLSCRAKAETERGGYFAALAAQAPDDPSLRLLKLEYFRRYQVDVQRKYFEWASRRHATAAQWTLRFGAYAVGLSSIPVFFGGALGLSNGYWTALGALSVIGGAVSAYASAHEAMSQDKRNAERYENALEGLELLAAKLDEVRAAVAAGSADALKVFVAAVNEQLATEHRQWLEAGQGAKKALETVEAALTKFEKGGPEKG